MNKTTFGILTIALNSYGVPCFIQGDVKTGIMRIVLACVSCGVIGVINMVKGIFLGIDILKMTEEEFQAKMGTFDAGIPAMEQK